MAAAGSRGQQGAASSLLRLGRGHLGLGSGGLTKNKTWWGACCWLTIPLLLPLCRLSVAMPQEAPILCINNCGFYGSSTTNNMCSKCYKDFIKLTENPAVEKKAIAGASSSSSSAVPPLEAAAAAQEQPPDPPTSNRCLTCRKKVGLTGFQCRCGGTFCSMHRYMDSHQCSFDYKTADREKIAKQNPVVMADKINKI